jgi:hypothetical protein
MKKLFTLLMVFAFTFCAFSQAPQKMSYQAVVRNSSNALVTSSPVGMRVSILQGSPTGTEVYKEIYNPNPQTNANGLVTIEIGSGIPLTGTFAAIDWSAGPYYIKTETDPTGGTNYTILGTSQLLSVPYALYAKTVATNANLSGMVTSVGNLTTVVTNANLTGEVISTGNTTTITNSAVMGKVLTGFTSGAGTVAATDNILQAIQKLNGNITNGFTHYVGELYGGGIVVAVWKVSGVEHGLIASLDDLSSGAGWSNLTNTMVPSPFAKSYSDGLVNSTAINAQSIISAAHLCRIYSATGDGGLLDWYLPAYWELKLCYNAALVVNAVLGSSTGFKTEFYWSSTERASNTAGGFHFSWGSNGGVNDVYDKGTVFRVRAVRRF